MGLPEGNTALAPAALHLATAPKSNAVYEAYIRAAEDADRDVAPAAVQRADEADEGSRNTGSATSARGFEKEIKRRLDGWEAIKKKRRS